jgi:hypothetical protein
MADQFTFYRFAFPFRSRLQARLCEERLNVDVDAFARPFDDSSRPEVPRLLWDMIRERAFVSDFRPDLDDSLDKVHAMGWEEVEDEMILPLLKELGLSTSGIDFTGFDFTSITTPREVIAFILKIAEAQDGGGKQRFVALA